jgi:transposase
VPLIVLGVDAHKKTHTVVGADPVGRPVAQITLPATDTGHQELITWARGMWPDGAQARLWSVEDCRHVTLRLERALLAAGERVVRVPPHLMAAARTSARTRGKSDPIDALAVARVALREPNLPVASHDQQSRNLKLLVDFRDDLVARRTAVINRLRWRLHELDPQLPTPDRALRALSNIDRLIRQVAHPVRSAAAHAAGLDLLRAVAREELADTRALTKRIDDLERQITTLVRQLGPALLTVPGCGVLSAAKILAETAAVTTIQISRLLRRPRRGRTHSRILRTNQPAPTDPRRQPPAQLGIPPHRRHPNPPARTRPRLLPAQTQQRRHHHGSAARHETKNRPAHLQHPQTLRHSEHSGSDLT